MALSISTRQFFEKFLRVPDGKGRLVPLALHVEQKRLLDAWDATDPAGLPLFPEVLEAWIKKAGKSTTAGGLALRELVRRERIAELKELLGTIELDVDVARSRRRPGARK